MDKCLRAGEEDLSAGIVRRCTPRRILVLVLSLLRTGRTLLLVRSLLRTRRTLLLVGRHTQRVRRWRSLGKSRSLHSLLLVRRRTLFGLVVRRWSMLIRAS